MSLLEEGLEILGFDGLNVLQNNGVAAGQQINHFHLHLIPRYNDDATIFQYEPQKPSEDELAALLEKFKQALGCV